VPLERIEPRLIQRLRTRLGLSESQVYRLIAQRVHQTRLPRRLAAIDLAGENDISISQFASKDDLAILRQAARPVAPQPAPAAPPVAAAAPRPSQGSRRRQRATPRRENTVFVAYGRNEDARAELFTFLRAIGVHPIEWGEAVIRTRQGSPYVGDILETAIREEAAIIVLLTADDEARLIERFRRPEDPEYESQLVGQPRANVLFEAGMAFGGRQQNTVLVQMGSIRRFSDIEGRHVIRLNNTVARRQDLATRLRAAGCTVNMDGTDWHRAGNLEV
jgi:predicted nucleotide-binding protein